MGDLRLGEIVKTEVVTTPAGESYYEQTRDLRETRERSEIDHRDQGHAEPSPTAGLGSGSVHSLLLWIRVQDEDDEACRAALCRSDLMLFHSLKPLLKKNKDLSFCSVRLQYDDVKSLLHKLGTDLSLIQDSVLIGCSERGTALFCLDLASLDAAAIEEVGGAKFVDLRKSFFLLSDSEAPLVAKAQALLRWHRTHTFCSVSGKRTTRNKAGSQRLTEGSEVIHYPQMSPVVIALVHDGSRCLLGRQISFPPGLYSALAGFCDMGETVEETVRREVAEEVGLEVLSITYSGSQHWPFPNSSFMIGCLASVSPAHSELCIDHSELEDARWFDLAQVQTGLRSGASKKGLPVVTWFPPSHAIAHKLIREWVELQTQAPPPHSPLSVSNV